MINMVIEISLALFLCFSPTAIWLTCCFSTFIILNLCHFLCFHGFNHNLFDFFHTLNVLKKKQDSTRYFVLAQPTDFFQIRVWLWC